MDWYDRLTHDPGCSLAYLRDFVSPDHICSCYQSVLDQWPEARPSWWDTLYSMSRQAPRVLPYYSTGEIRLAKKPVGKTFGIW